MKKYTPAFVKFCQVESEKNLKMYLKMWNSCNFSSFPACFSIPIFFSNLTSNCSNLLDIEKSRTKEPRNKLKSILLPKIVLTFLCLNKLFKWSQKCCKFFAFSLKFKKFSWSLEQFFSQQVRTILVTMVFCYQNCSDLLWEKMF